ncbi:methyltransferase domain-containing protein [Magnetovibrio sp. PR-2]|uniref:methyltransferase domain-containing protein n=1 Tax=Magnetovibrio sp. PR-2 TaxID=3120356 RepID=UPI002FCE6728
MSSLQALNVDFFRCPSCHSENMIAGSDGDVWAKCSACGEQFSYFDDFPFLVSQSFMGLVRDANSVTIEAQNLDAMPADVVKQANIKFHNDIAEQYEHDVSTYDIFKEGGACQHRLQETIQEAGKASGNDVLLDVCCGTGNVLRTADNVFKNCIGIDISTNMMKIAHKRELEVLGADATNIPFANDSVNCVTAFSALHHLVDYTDVVQEMARVLKSGGTFYTDWDPNGHVTHTGWAVSLLVNTVHWVRRMILKGQIPETDEQQVAEFHHNSGPGFEAEKVAEVLRNANFKSVEVVYHLNPNSFSKSSKWSPVIAVMGFLKLISFVSPTPKNLYPWVAVRAIK